MPFYGNITNKRNQFTYDKIYPSLYSLYTSINFDYIDENNIKIRQGQDDGIFVGRYVLIDYDDTSDGQDRSAHEDADNREYNRYFDSTVWQKIYKNGSMYYVLIASFNLQDEQMINDILYTSQQMPENVTEIDTNGNPILTNLVEFSGVKLYKYIQTNGSVIYWIGEFKEGNITFRRVINTQGEGLIYLIDSLQQNIQEAKNAVAYSISESDYNQIMSIWS